MTGAFDVLMDPAGLLTSTRGATFVALLAPLVVVWAIGDQVRAARERLEVEGDRALQAARERDATARLDALAERRRIARELHDVVAHGLSVLRIVHRRPWTIIPRVDEGCTGRVRPMPPSRRADVADPALLPGLCV